MQPILEVTIGLTLLMVVFSVVVSATVETISMLFTLRAKNLEAGIRRMLSAAGGRSDGDPPPLADAVLEHPLITALANERGVLGKKDGRRPPAYIAPNVFSAAMVDALLARAGNVAGRIDEIDTAIAALPNELKERLQTIRRHTVDSVGDFRKGVEGWFDDQMDRVSGWYTRWAQMAMLLVGVAAALLLNVSAVTVARVLWHDPVLRTELVTEAEEAGDEQTPDEAPATGVGTDVELSRFPVGWNSTAWPGLNGYLALHLLGVLAVGLAASLGAPFWFDLLSKVANLRSVGPKPSSDR
jgi:hypothetical protein